MSAQSRYRTLVANTGAIYSASQENRTSLLQKGLDEIVGAIQPMNSDQWSVVKTDSERLLKVWFSKERDHDPAAQEVVTQLVDLLRELSTDVPSPVLVVTDRIAHVHDRPLSLKEDAVEVASYKESEADEEEVKAEEEVEETEEEVEVEEEEAEETVEEEEEVEEAEAEEEVEEEGLEVEQITIRGRTYWLETNTKKLYAIVGEDDVGDEVGALVNGKPVFLS